MLSGSAPEKESENNCAICHEAVTTSNSISLHKPGESYDHRLHLDCLQPFLLKINPPKCPLCQTLVEKDVILHYKTIETALAASLRKNDLHLTNDQMRKYATSKDFNLEKFKVHFDEYVKSDKFDFEKLKNVIGCLDLKFVDITDSLSVSSFNFLKNASNMFSFEKLLGTDRNNWLSKFPAIVKMALQFKWYPIDDPSPTLKKLCLFMEGRKFVTAEIWQLACPRNSPDLLKILLPHIIPSCFKEGLKGVEIAVKDANSDLINGLMAIDKKLMMENLRNIVSTADFICPNIPITESLLEYGFEPDELFKIDEIFRADKRAITVLLLKRGLWPLKYFTDLNGPHFRRLKALQKAYNSLQDLRDLFELCLLLFGLMFYPEHSEWLYELYATGKILAEEFEKHIDLVSNERVYNSVTGTLKALIHGSWASKKHFEDALKTQHFLLVEMYEFEVCRDIPVLSPADLDIAEKGNESLLQLLGALDIPIYPKEQSELIDFIKDADKEGLVEYIKKSQLTPAELEKAIDMSFVHGNSEIVKILMNYPMEHEEIDSSEELNCPEGEQ